MDSATKDFNGVIITGDLDRRPSRAPDYQAEAYALTALAEAMSTNPDTMLQRLVEVAMKLTRSDSAGISLLEPGGENGTFRWVATAGAWSPYRDGTMPREVSPCGEVIAREAVLLMKKPERSFPALLQAEPGISEGLLAPFHLGGIPVGTLWTIKHSPDGQFEAEDARILKSLARFAAVAHQTVQALQLAKAANQHAEIRVQQLVALAEISTEFFGTCDMEFMPIYGNAAAMRMVGLADLDQVKRTPVREFFFPEDLAFITDDFFPRVLRDGQGKVEIRFRHFVTGEPVWVDYSLVILKDEMGRATGLGTVTHGLTERKGAEKALLESQARQAFLLKLSDALRPISDPGDVMAAASEALGQHLEVGRAGYGEVDADNEWFIVKRDWTDGVMGSMVGRHRVADFGPESVAAHRSDRTVVVDDSLIDARFTGYEVAFKAIQLRASIVVPLVKDGRWIAGFYAHQSTSRRWTEDDERLIRDVVDRTWAAVERARAEAALRKSEAKFRNLFETMAQGYTLVELVRDGSGKAVDQRYLEFNPAIQRLLGAPAADVTGKLASEAFPGIEPEWTETFDRVVRTGKPDRIEHFFAPLGRWFEVYAYPAGGDRFIALYEDVTERKQAETALRVSEERFRALATVGSSSVYRMSPDWREMRSLDGAAFLADSTEASSDWIETYIPPDERSRVREAINRAIVAKDVFELEHRVLRADNTIGWTFSRAMPLFDEFGDISEWFGAATDVTARVKADQRYTRLFQASPAPFLVLKPDAPRFTIAEVNDAYLSATMRTRDEVVGRGIFEAYPDNPSDKTVMGASTLRASLDKVLSSCQPDTLPNLKYDIARPDGTFEERWWSPVNSAVLDDDGEVEALIHNANDVTEERQAEVALRESEERLQTLMTRIPQMVWRSCSKGLWTWVGPQWLDFTGQTQEESQSMGWLDVIHLEDHEATKLAWADARPHGQLDIEFRVRRATDGAWLWHHTRSVPIRNEQGRIIEWLGTSTDMQVLKEFQKRQGVLVAELQHRTRNLIAIVRSTSDKTARASADLNDFRTRFRARLDALARVQGLLSRLNDLDRVTFDELIKAELTAMDSNPDKVTLEGPFGIRLRSSTVQTLAMALHELATNALKYGALGQPDARLSVTWRWEPSGEGGNPWLHIEWRESGVNMASIDAAPRGTGQGRELIERALPYQLSAKTNYELGPDGVHCTISLPVSATAAPEVIHD